MFDCIVIGKGPAGISAAIYIKRSGLQVLVIGKDGGALEKAEAIDNYYGMETTFSGKELQQKGIQQAKKLGIRVETEEVIGISELQQNYKVITRDREYEAKTIILATGTSRKTIPIKGIKEMEGKGVSYCAVCDAFFYRNKKVSVIGSGDYALAEVKQLKPLVKSVTILTNGEKLVENRSEELQEVEVNEKRIEEVLGEQRVRGVRFTDQSELGLDGVFLAIGTASSTELAKKLGVITQDNCIAVDDNMATNVPGVFACGDCTGGLLQIAKAVYEGAKAGLTVIRYCHNR